nr:expressed protein [Hymenolepis microstoma]
MNDEDEEDLERSIEADEEIYDDPLEQISMSHLLFFFFLLAITAQITQSPAFPLKGPFVIAERQKQFSNGFGEIPTSPTNGHHTNFLHVYYK